MEPTHIFILAITIGLAIMLFFRFKKSFKKQYILHKKELHLYAERLQKHKEQIIKRGIFLNQYDLLNYNLSESLLVQHQIKL